MCGLGDRLSGRRAFPLEPCVGKEKSEVSVIANGISIEVATGSAGEL